MTANNRAAPQVGDPEGRAGTVLAWRLQPPPPPGGWPFSIAGTVLLLLIVGGLLSGAAVLRGGGDARWPSVAAITVFATTGVVAGALMYAKSRRHKNVRELAAVWRRGSFTVAGLFGLMALAALRFMEFTPGGWPIAGVISIGLLLWAISVALTFPMWAELPRRQLLSEEFRTWDELVNRLRESPDAQEREHLFGGMLVRSDAPLLLHDALTSSHVAIWGATRSGKSSRALMPLCIQQIRRRNRRIVYFDLKGSKPEFGALGIACRRAKVDFRWLTKESLLSSYVFNPLDQPEWRSLTLDEKAELLLAAMSLDYGDAESGTAYFGSQAEEAIRGALKLRPELRSFRELDDVIREPGFAERIGMSRRDFENCGALRAMLSRLRSGSAFNWVEGDPGGSRVAEGKVTISRILNEPGLLYVRLPATLEPSSARALPRLITRLLVAAARRQGGARQPVILVYDEAQETLQRTMSTILKQARDVGISLWLAFQNLSDLEVAGEGLSDIVLGNTSVRIFFSATDKGGREYAALVSGIVRRLLRAVGITVTESSNGTSLATSESAAEVEVPRLGPEEINWLNATEGVCVVEASPKSGYTRLTRPEFVFAPHFCTPGVYRRLTAIPWPPGNDFTIVNDDTPPGTPPASVPPAPAPSPNPSAVAVESAAAETSPVHLPSATAGQGSLTEAVDLQRYLLQLTEPDALAQNQPSTMPAPE